MPKRFPLLLAWCLLTTAQAQNRPIPDSGNRNRDCIALDKINAEVAKVTEQVSQLNQQSVSKLQACNPLSGDTLQRCLAELNAVRPQLASLATKLAPLNDEKQRLRAVCPETTASDEKQLALYEKLATDSCPYPRTQKRCEDALFNMADISYKIDQRNNLIARQTYERAYQEWKSQDPREKEPRPTAPSYAKGLAAHTRYLEQIPHSGRRDILLYRTAFLYDQLGRSADAIPLLMEISRAFPQSRQITPTNVRLGEYFFQEKKYDSAISYYNKVDSTGPNNGDLVGLAIFHKAESWTRLDKIPQAIETYFDYLEHADKGQIRADLRSDVLDGLGSSFAELPNPYNNAKAWFGRLGGRSYEDTVYYALAAKLADRNQRDLAIPALYDFLKTYPDHDKAPLAQARLVEVFATWKQNDAAQKARYELVERYAPGSAWWQKPRNFGKQELKQIRNKIRNVTFEAAMMLHYPGKELHDSKMVEQAVVRYQQFITDYQSVGNWTIYRAKLYLADALSYLGRHQEAADQFSWAEVQNTKDPQQYGEPSLSERRLMQPIDATYNIVAELKLAVAAEIGLQGNRVQAYKQPLQKRYKAALENYLAKYPRAPDVPDMSFDLFTLQFDGQDWSKAIDLGNRLVRNWPTFRYITQVRSRLDFAQAQLSKGPVGGQ